MAKATVLSKEIDFLKTGVRWSMSKSLRQHAKRLPYFLLYNYPKKMETYRKTAKARRGGNKQLQLNAYHSPSPMNELCDFVESWEKKNILWANNAQDTRLLTVDYSLDLSDTAKRRKILHCVNQYSRKMNIIVREKLRLHQSESDTTEISAEIDALYAEALGKLKEIEPSFSLLANYAIDVIYERPNQNQSFVWRLFGDVILDNIRKHTPERSRLRIIEVPYQTATSYEYLGKYYELLTGVSE